MNMWPRFGIQRHFETMAPADVAAAVVFALDAPMHVDVLEVQPVLVAGALSGMRRQWRSSMPALMNSIR